MKGLTISGLHAGYEKLHILHGIDMSCRSGNITVIIGPNGAGKSTVLKSIFALCDIYHGNIIYNGINITRLPTYERIANGISIVPQGRQVFSNLSVLENLEIGAFITQHKEMIDMRMQEVLCHFPVLRSKLSQNAYNLSGGEQQMLAMARGLMQDPQLLLLDEPSLGLAPKVMKEVFDTIQDINKEGVSILMVEQNAKAACQIADQIYVLEQGQVVLKGGRKIIDDPRIKQVYLGGHK
ncbi:MAG: ABC transporter ATP-binding protein [Nanoarchaeota archaeon]